MLGGKVLFNKYRQVKRGACMAGVENNYRCMMLWVLFHSVKTEAISLETDSIASKSASSHNQ